jgi:hypothetical protein
MSRPRKAKTETKPKPSPFIPRILARTWIIMRDGQRVEIAATPDPAGKWPKQPELGPDDLWIETNQTIDDGLREYSSVDYRSQSPAFPTLPERLAALRANLKAMAEHVLWLPAAGNTEESCAFHRVPANLDAHKALAWLTAAEKALAKGDTVQFGEAMFNLGGIVERLDLWKLVPKLRKREAMDKHPGRPPRESQLKAWLRSFVGALYLKSPGIQRGTVMDKITLRTKQPDPLVRWNPDAATGTAYLKHEYDTEADELSEKTVAKEVSRLLEDLRKPK